MITPPLKGFNQPELRMETIMIIKSMAITSDMVCKSCYVAMAADPDFQGDLDDYIIVNSPSDCIGCTDDDN